MRTIELNDYEHDLISRAVGAQLLTYLGHHATDGLFEREQVEMEKLKALADKLKAAATETK